MIEKIDATTFRESVTTFKEYDLNEMEARLTVWKDAIIQDANDLQHFTNVRTQLDLTSLPQEEKDRIFSAVIHSPSGITQKMVDELGAEIARLKAL